jgi:hypothetical protein
MAGLAPAIHDFVSLPGSTGQSSNHCPFRMTKCGGYWIPGCAGMTLGICGCLAKTWTRLAAEPESDQALLAAMLELKLSDRYEALPRALRLHS